MTTTDLPADLAALDAVLPVRPLAALVRPGSPRWAYAVLAADLCGPWRSAPRVGDELLDRGLPARPERPSRVLDGYRDTRTSAGVVREPLYRDGPLLPAQAAVPPLRPVLKRAETEEALLALVQHLDALAGVQEPPTEPDAPEGWTAPSWAPMRSIISGQEPPPLRWEAPSRATGRPELAALRPRTERHPRLIAMPRSAPPVLRSGLGGGLLAVDARLLGLRALVEHAQAGEQPVDGGDLRALAAWLVGPDRAVLTEAARTAPEGFRIEHSAPGVRQAEAVLASTRPEAVVEALLAPSEAATDGARTAVAG